MSKIVNGARYKITTTSKYLVKKYGKEFVAWVEGTDLDVWGSSWGIMNGNPTAMNYGMRSGLDGISFAGEVYYCKIAPLEGFKGMTLAELLHESEFEGAVEIKE